MGREDGKKLLTKNGARTNKHDHENHCIKRTQSPFLAARTKQNKTPFDLADEKEHFEVAKYLLEKKKQLQSNNLPNEIMSAKAFCIICLTPRNGIYVLYPCGHTSLCEPCCYKLKKEKYSKCPSCRKPIKDYTKIFFQEAPSSVSD